MSNSMIKQIIDGRTDLVFDCLAEGHAAASPESAKSFVAFLASSAAKASFSASGVE